MENYYVSIKELHSFCRFYVLKEVKQKYNFMIFELSITENKRKTRRLIIILCSPINCQLAYIFINTNFFNEIVLTNCNYINYGKLIIILRHC